MIWKDDCVSVSEMRGWGEAAGHWFSLGLVCLAKESVVEVLESDADLCVCFSYFGRICMLSCVSAVKLDLGAFAIPCWMVLVVSLPVLKGFKLQPSSSRQSCVWPVWPPVQEFWFWRKFCLTR